MVKVTSVAQSASRARLISCDNGWKKKKGAQFACPGEKIYLSSI